MVLHPARISTGPCFAPRSHCPPPPACLPPLPACSFTFQHDPDLRAQLVASIGHGSAGSGASSITFQTAAAASKGLEVM